MSVTIAVFSSTFEIEIANGGWIAATEFRMTLKAETIADEQ